MKYVNGCAVYTLFKAGIGISITCNGVCNGVCNGESFAQVSSLKLHDITEYHYSCQASNSWQLAQREV